MTVVIFVCTPVQPIMLNRMSIAKPWKKNNIFNDEIEA